MNSYIKNERKMTSVEISEITGKNHKDVLESIRGMENSWVKAGGNKFEYTSYIDNRNREKPCYSLTKTECLYVATKYNDEARAKLVLRWEKLEKENLIKDISNNFYIPKDYSSALMLASTLSKELEEIRPKAKYTDDVLLSPEKLTTTEVAKSFGMKSPQKLNGILINLGVQYKTKHNYVLCSPYSDLGYVRVNTNITSDGEEKLVGTTYQLVWTEKGRNFLYNLLLEKGYLEKKEDTNGSIKKQ